jgi:hypothetical protein
MLGCLLWSGLGAVVFYAVIVFFGLGARTLAVLPAWVGVVKQIESEEIINFDTPGTIEVTLNKGPHMIVSQRPFVGHEFEIVSFSSGQSVLVERETREIKYELEQLEGNLLFHFDVPEDGRYRITEEAVTDNSVKIAPNYSVRNQIAIFLFYSLLVGSIILIVWLRRRPKMKVEAIERQTTAREKAAKWDALTNSPNDGQNE